MRQLKLMAHGKPSNVNGTTTPDSGTGHMGMSCGNGLTTGLCSVAFANINDARNQGIGKAHSLAVSNRARRTD